MLLNFLCKLFQLCFDTGKVPSIWLVSIINPIIKSKDSDPRTPLNYRGISLVCCTAKLYSNVINSRIVKHLDNEDIIVDEQNGFRGGDRSCIDHIFILNSLCANRILEGKPAQLLLHS